MRGVGRTVAAVVVALLVGACGARVPYEPLAGPPSDAAPSRLPAAAPSLTGPPSRRSEPADPTGHSPSLRAQLARQDEAFRHMEHHNEVVRLSVQRPCIAPGTRQTVHVSGPPGAQITLAVAYSDGASHGAMGIAQADDGGRYTWTFLVDPGAPRGLATVFAGSSGPRGGQGGGTAHAGFEVTPAGRC